MAIYPLLEDNISFHTIETYPSKSYQSYVRRDSNGNIIYTTASNGNIEEVLDNTGSIPVFALQSPIEKEAYSLLGNTYTTFEDTGLEALRRQISLNTSTDKYSLMRSYMQGVYDTTASLRKQKKMEIIRFTPSVNFSSNTLRKTIITDMLMKYYRTGFISSNFNFTNYNSLNFFTGLSGVVSQSFMIPTQSVLLYPNLINEDIGGGLYQTDYGKTSSGSITFDFWINPKYTVGDNETYKPGVLLHLTGAYAISLHSGSYKDHNGYVKKFKLCYQIDTGTNTKPSELSSTTSNIFFSDDNVLEHNKWHHVTIRHGGVDKNYSGSFVVDGTKKGDFAYSTNPNYGIYDIGDPLKAPEVLCVGNYYEGANVIADFFNTDAATRDGLYEMSTSPVDPDLSDYTFAHPLQAEVHDIKIYDKYLTLNEISDLQTDAPQSLSKLKLYIPPFFTEESPYRQYVGTHGGYLSTPFMEKDGTTTTPYNGELAFAVNGHYMNLENYVRDFVTGRYPRLYNLTGSAETPPNTTVEEANYFLYTSGTYVGANKRRLYTILPCDHGDWQPNFSFLNGMSGSKQNHRYSNDLNNLDIGNINLRNVVTGSSNTTSFTTTFSGSSITSQYLGAGPENLTESPNNDLTIYNRLQNGDSNQVVIFDVSNLFYGKNIKPGSIVLKDNKLYNSDSRLSMTLRDDGRGNIYRAGSTNGTFPTWASVGNIFYNEGVIILKAPQLCFFGKEGFEISFRGVQNVYTTKFNCIARPLDLISSSNTSWSPDLEYDSELMNEPDQRFVYITGINIHDDNMNIIMKARLAQPVAKKSGDKILFKPSIVF